MERSKLNQESKNDERIIAAHGTLQRPHQSSPINLGDNSIQNKNPSASFALPTCCSHTFSHTESAATINKKFITRINEVCACVPVEPLRVLYGIVQYLCALN